MLTAWNISQGCCQLETQVKAVDSLSQLSKLATACDRRQSRQQLITYAKAVSSLLHLSKLSSACDSYQSCQQLVTPVKTDERMELLSKLATAVKAGNCCQSYQQLVKPYLPNQTFWSKQLDIDFFLLCPVFVTIWYAMSGVIKLKLNHTYQTKPSEVNNLTLIFFFYAQYLSPLDMKCQEWLCDVKEVVWLEDMLHEFPNSWIG